jgi:hypothetical protein
MSNAKKLLPVGSLVDFASFRPQDLLPAFLDLLRSVDAPEYDQLMINHAIPAYALEDDSAEWWDSEECQYLINDITDALNIYTPDNHYFGSSQGNGSDFGVWPFDEIFD